MEIAEILRILERNTGTFPGCALEAAIERREEITPELLQILEETLGRAEEIAAQDKQGAYFAHLYAMYLLAQFREARAYSLVVRLARLDASTLDALCGDFVTEDLCRVLASVCNGDTRLIEELIEDPNVYEYARSAALRSLLVLVAEGGKSRDEVMAYYKSLFEGKLERSCSHAWDSLVACAVRLHPGEVAGHIALAFEEGLVNSFFISPNNVERALGQEKESILENLPNVEGGYIENVVNTLSSWGCFKQPKRSARGAIKTEGFPDPEGAPEPIQPARSGRVKPNERCPCGSGRKYKKCCGRVASPGA